MKKFFFFLCFLPIFAFAKVRYKVFFEGLNDPPTLKMMKTISGLTTLKERHPHSINALRYRAETDLPELLNVLKAQGYYDGDVNIRIDDSAKIVRVIVSIQPGQRYRIEEYAITFADENERDFIDLENLGIELGMPAISQAVIDGEMKLLELLSEEGYPMAKVEHKEIIVDGKNKTMKVTLEIDRGEKAEFGEVTVDGLTGVDPLLIEQKIQWEEGEVYNSRLLEKTQTALMDTQLFSSVQIMPEEQMRGGFLPVKIELAESKHRSLSVGVSYQTFFGPGATFGWEGRNLFEMGRKFTLQGDITTKSHSGIALLLVPDFGEIGQDYIWEAQAFQEDLDAYSQRSYHIMNRVEKRVGEMGSFSTGVKLERLFVSDSVDNGNFTLFEVPTYMRWNHSNSLLNPTKGYAMEYKLTPTVNFEGSGRFYGMQQLTQSWYIPLTKNEMFSIAQKLTLGSILSTSLDAVPVPKRFFGGSEEDLRGYAYQTVSPLNAKGKPIGGRSAIYYTFELRTRFSEAFGLVPFFDIGNVYTQVLPTLGGKWLKSVGIGLRFFTFMGPFRLDIGVPLNRRKNLDPHYQILVSIGQSF